MIGLFSKRKREAKLEAAIRKEMAAGLYHRALPFFLERRRYSEAAKIEVKRGHTEEAAQLYQRGQHWREAADTYLSTGAIDLAATSLTKGNMVKQAAQLYAEHGRHDQAGRLYLDLGSKREAGEAYALAGDFGRAAELLDGVGDTARAGVLRAELAMVEKRWREAAEAFESFGHKERAAQAWDKAKEPARAALMRATAGNYKGAVEALLEAGDFGTAASLLEEHDDLRGAAHAAYRGGELDRAAGYLDRVGDYVTMAKLYLEYGRRDEAKQALLKVGEGERKFESAMEKLAALHVEDGNTKAAYKAFGRLVERRLAAGGPFGDEVRRWIVEMVGLLIGHKKTRAALGCFETLDQCGLMTQHLSAQRDELRVALGEAPVGARARDGEESEPSNAVKKLSSAIQMPRSDRYEFRRKIGQGGNGAIYLALDTVLNREVVIKMIINTQLPNDLARKWFFREAQVSARLNHPNIVTVYDLSELEGQPYIAMEYVQGQDLAEFLDDKVPLQPHDAWPIMRQFTEALQYAHDQNVVHRDVKLENVMITPDGTVKLMDFGLAKAIQGGSTTMVIAGTPAYMSPEQIFGTNVDHRTDIYASGVMLFYILTGHFPYEEGNLLEAHRSRAIPDPRDHVPGMQAGFENIILHALAKKKEDRYDRISDLARDFQRLAMRGRH